MKLSLILLDLIRDVAALGADLPDEWRGRVQDILEAAEQLHADLVELERVLSGDELEPTGADG